MPLKIDLHVHSCYSEDSTSSLDEIIFYAKKKGLNGVAITDHDSLIGARKALELASKEDFIVIPGVEVTTLQGHVLALNIATAVPQNLSLLETVEKIHDAGGIAIAAHPLSFIKANPLVLMRANPLMFMKNLLNQRASSALNLDGVEAINSSAFPFFLSTRLTKALAERLGLPQTAGSDAHDVDEIGTAYTLVKADSDTDEITEAIKRGAVIPLGKSISWETRIRRGASHLKKWI